MKKHITYLIKSISWRITATITTTILAFLFTKDLQVSLIIGIGEFIIKVVLYYLHELFWEKIKWKNV